ncbi:MAG: hypothetical protein GW792_00870 [Thiomicrospira sp.]|nr:hypothetical protein [Thiomicrospira sp.]
MRGAKRRGNPHPPPVIARSEATWQSTPTPVIARSEATWQSTPTPVIARSAATWQSIFQAVQDESWIASPAARNDGGRLAAMTVGGLS